MRLVFREGRCKGLGLVEDVFENEVAFLDFVAKEKEKGKEKEKEADKGKQPEASHMPVSVIASSS
jgi:hypothetical protein